MGPLNVVFRPMDGFFDLYDIFIPYRDSIWWIRCVHPATSWINNLVSLLTRAMKRKVAYQIPSLVDFDRSSSISGWSRNGNYQSAHCRAYATKNGHQLILVSMAHDKPMFLIPADAELRSI